MLWIRKNKHATRPNKLSIETDKIYLYFLDLYEPKYKFLITKCEEVKKKNYYDGPCPFMKYQNNINNIYTNINDYDPTKKSEVLIIFDDTVTDMIDMI